MFHTLGFLNPENRRNLGFIGAPSNLSKKGLYLSQTSKMAPPPDDAASPPPAAMQASISSQSTPMLSKRTEFLESQERRHAATLSQQISTQHDMSHEMGVLHSKSAQLYNETQFVYGRVSRHGLTAVVGTNGAYSALDAYVENRGRFDREQIASSGMWVQLVYPMKKAPTPAGYELLMRCRRVNRRTGQLSVDWVVVHSADGGTERRHVDEYSSYPG